MLLASGVPLLIVPNDWKGDTIGDRIMIGWNATPEARRAVTDAMSFLVAATSVKAVIVDPAACKWLGENAGCDIGGHLNRRHGASVEVEQVASRGRPIAEVILDRAMQCDLDLLRRRLPQPGTPARYPAQARSANPAEEDAGPSPRSPGESGTADPPSPIASFRTIDLSARLTTVPVAG